MQNLRFNLFYFILYAGYWKHAWVIEKLVLLLRHPKEKTEKEAEEEEEQEEKEKKMKKRKRKKKQKVTEPIHLASVEEPLVSCE